MIIYKWCGVGISGMFVDVVFAFGMDFADWSLAGVGPSEGSKQIFVLNSSIKMIVFQHKAFIIKAEYY